MALSFHWLILNEAFMDSPKRLRSDLRRTSDVLAVLEFQIACLRAETPALYSRNLLTNHEGHGQKLRHPRRFRGREREFQRSGTARTSTY